MINIVSTASHAYTVTRLVEVHGNERVTHWSYENLFQQHSIPNGTWIFTDHERLSFFELEVAARVAQLLLEAGSRVLNHPAHVHSRSEILRRLKDAGINQFSTYHCDSDPKPDMFPVFIRNTYDHSTKSPDLIENQDQLELTLQQMEQRGIPLVGKLVIELSAEETLPGVWRRLASYHLAGRTIAHHMAFDDRWCVKNGFGRRALTNHPQKDYMIKLEREFVENNLYSDTIDRAFAIAGLDYGRADFSIVDGNVQIYELNTNPHHGGRSTFFNQPQRDRRATQNLSEDQLQLAILQLGSPPGKSLVLDNILRNSSRKNNGWIGRVISWRP